MSSCRFFAKALVFLFAAPLFTPSVTLAAEHRFVLSSATSETNLESFNLSDHVPESIRSKWKVTQRALHGGMQEGVDIITIDNGQIVVEIVPTRGMSILRVSSSRTGEQIFGWDSPVKEVVHPSYVDLEGRGGLGWLQGFNEWMVRCGLEYAGHPGADRFTTNTGDQSELDLTLHGKIGNIPASEVELVIEKQAPYRLSLHGVVHERMFYGPKLQLKSTLKMHPGESTIELSESIQNLGASEQEYQIIYHTNFGRPILEKNAKVVVAAAKVTPMNDQAAKHVKSFETYPGPTLGFVEEVYLVEPYVDSSGATAAVLHNADQTRGALMRWSTEHLPYLTLWKNTAALPDGYVTGIEPGTGFPFNRRIERHFGRVPVLKPGQSHNFSLQFSWLQGDQAIRNAIEMVQEIAGGRSSAIETSPPELPNFEE